MSTEPAARRSLHILFLSIGSFDANYSDYHLMRDLLAAFLAAGHRVTLLQKQYEPEAFVPEVLRPYVQSGRLVFVNTPFVRAPRTSFAKRYLADLRYYAHCCRRMSREAQPDAVFLQSNNTAFLPVRWAKRHGVPLLYSEQDIFPQNAAAAGMMSARSPVFRAVWALQRDAYRSAARVVTISQDMRGVLAVAGADEKTLDVVYNWGHTPQPISLAAQQNGFLQEYPQPPDVFRAVYAGNLGTMQNVELVLNAAVLLKEERDVRFFIIGDGARREALLRQAEEQGLANVTFLRMFPAARAPELYAMADVNLVPLGKGVIYTALPSKLADCLAVGRPLILSIDETAQFAAEAAAHGAVVTPPDSPRALADAVLVARDAWRAAGQSTPPQPSLTAWFEACFSKEKNVQEYVDLIEQTAQR